MASLVMKKLASLNSSSPSCRHHNLTFLTPLFHFSTQTQQKEDLPFIARYLMSSFGFSKDRALRVATKANLAAIKTPDRPDSVIRFFKDHGLTDTEIKSLVSWGPQILGSNVEKTLKPRANELITAGFGGNTFIQLIKFNPLALNLMNTLSVLQFWRSFLNNDEEALLKVIKSHNKMLINLNIDKRIIPRINLLRQYGLSDQQIARITTHTTYFLDPSPDSIKSSFEQIEKVGFTRGSKMFLVGLIMFGSIRKDTLDTKIAFFKKTFGWSEEDVNLALKKYPALLGYSQEKLSSTMDFLIRKAGLNTKSIALRPRLLGCSLERRLIPRHYVLSMLKLKSKGLKNNRGFYTVAIMSERLFVEKFILPYKELLPNLEEEYAAACAGKHFPDF